MKHFFDSLQKLSTDELRTLAAFCTGASLLIGVALVLSGTLPGLSTNLKFALQRAGFSQGATVILGSLNYAPYWQAAVYPSFPNASWFPYPDAGAAPLFPDNPTYGTYCLMDANSGYASAPTGSHCEGTGAYGVPGIVTAVISATIDGSQGIYAYQPVTCTAWNNGNCAAAPYTARKTGGSLTFSTNDAVQLDWSCLPYQRGTGVDLNGSHNAFYWPFSPSGPVTVTASNGEVITTNGVYGSATVHPTGSSVTYTLNCGGTVPTVPIQILNSALISLAANPSTVFSGGISTLAWTIDTSTLNSCTITGPGGAVGAQGLGGDGSGNNATWALNNLSAADQTTDTPTNNFATVNQIYSYNSKPTISGGGLTVAGNWGGFAGWQLNSGKWYWEVTPLTGADTSTINGVQKDANSGIGSHLYPGHTNDAGFGWQADGRVWNNTYSVEYLPSYTAGDIIGVAYDADTGKVYFSKNGTWLSGDNLIPPMTAASSGGVVISQSTYWSGGYLAWNAGDKNPNNYWNSNSFATPLTSAAPQWLQADLGGAKAVGSYSITDYGSANRTFDPVNFTLQGSNTGAFTGEQANVDTQTGITWAYAGQTKIFTVQSPGSYRYYRLNITANSGGNQVIVAEFGLYPESNPSPADGTSYTGIVHGGWPGFMNNTYKSLVNFGQWQPATKIGGGVAFFNGTTDYITTPTTPDLVPQGDYTIDLWAYPTIASGAHGVLSSNTANDTAPFLIRQNGTSFLFYSGTASGSNNISAGQVICPTVVANNWYHLAVARSGNTYDLFCNGKLNVSFVASGSPWVPTDPLVVGREYQGGYYFQGYIDEVRMSNVARWVSSFNPQTTPYTSDTNTTLLLHMDDSALLNSATKFSHAMTLNGAVHYSPAAAYAAGSGGEFSYQPPSGYKAVSTGNLPTPAVAQPNQYFSAQTYAGTGAAQSVTGLNFQPDLVWLKDRTSGVYSHIYDSTRGAATDLIPSITNGNTVNYSGGYLNAFLGSGFSLVSGATNIYDVAKSGDSYSSWVWKKSPAAGIDVEAYTGTGAATQAVSHTLGTSPDTIIVKSTNAAGNWYVWNSGFSALGSFLKLNTTDASTITNSPFGADLIPTMTGPTTAGVTMSQSTYWGSSYLAWYTGDKNLNTYWNSSAFTAPLTAAAPQWIQVDFAAGTSVGAYTITPRTQDITYNPVSFTLQGSNTGAFTGEQVTLDTETASWIMTQPQTFYVPAANRGSYSHYRLNVTANGGGTQVIILEFNLWPASAVPTATQFTLTNNATNNLNASGGSYISYFFSNREGFQKSGTYLGNGSADGPFIYTGFKPESVMIKDVSAGNVYTDWIMYDSARDAGNSPLSKTLFADLAVAESGGTECNSTSCPVDFLANGFKLRSGPWKFNANSSNAYAYIAFADTPFKSASTAYNLSIPYSLRFDASNNGYLSRTPAVSGDRQKETLSFWLKRGQIGNAQALLTTPNRYEQVAFGWNCANDSLDVRIPYSAGGDLCSAALLRDPSHWYHIVIAVDSTQATPSNRVVLYIDGVQAAFSSGTQPPQNTNMTEWNIAGKLQAIGHDTYGNNTPFDGNLADFYMIDGQQLTPAYFGQYDTNGFWKPKTYAGTYGTNGFHLTFSNAGYTDFSQTSGTVDVGPLYQTSTYTLMCTATGGGSASASQTVTVTNGAALTLSACNSSNSSCSTSVGTPATAVLGSAPNVSWTSAGINANSCSVIQKDSSNVYSTVSAMGEGDIFTNKAGPALLQSNSTYTYTLACVAPATTGNNATLVNNPITGFAGKFGEAVALNGTSQYLTLGTPASLEGLQVPVTISGWFKQNTTAGTQPLYAAYLSTGGSQLWSLVRVDGGTLKYYTSTAAGLFQAFGSFAPAVGSWHFFSVVVSGSVSAPTITIYLDGASQSFAGSALSSSPSLTVPIYIGGDAAAPGELFNGYIDDIRVYNRALSASEVSTLYGGGQITGNLVGYWPLDTVSIPGSTAYDEAPGVTTSSAAVTASGPPSATISASTPVTVGGSSALTWSSSNINTNSCSVVQIDASGVTSVASAIGAGDSATNRSGPVLASAGTPYTYKLACYAPYTTGNNATLVGTPTTGATGKFGSEAITFDGATQYATLPVPAGNALDLDVTPVTISAWIKTNAINPAQLQSIVSRGYIGAQGYGLFVNTNGNINVGRSGGGNFDSTVPITAGSWYHVVGVINGASSKVYINGVDDTPATVSLVVAASDLPLNIGLARDSGNNPVYYFNGSIDDVRVYNRALSANEVSTLYTGGHITSGLVGYWPFDANSISGTTAYDLTGGLVSQTSNSVTVSGAPPTPPSGNMSLNATRVRAGTPSTLSWQVIGMAPGISCSITPALPGGMPAWNNLNPWYYPPPPTVSTALTAPISAPTKYTLTCTNGVTSSSFSKTVLTLPVFKEI